VIVRIAELSRAAVGKVLDLGADGVCVTRVESAEQVEDLVRYAKYAPAGERNVWIGLRHDGYARTQDWQTLTQELNSGVACIVMIETPQGAGAIDEICQVSGLDGVFIGAADLTHALGVIDDMNAGDYLEAEERILQACLRAGVKVGKMVRPGENARTELARGFALNFFGSEITALRNGVESSLALLEQARDEFLAEHTGV
jgi:2-dehydro-3-deoxyglucarate aldolase/4-hydroxy-2-oxoheptanedioate aldolase